MTYVYLRPGTPIGQYSLERMLGVGAFGVVWLATSPATGQQVAIKILHPNAAESPETVERFRREAYVLGQMESPHIAKMLDFLLAPPFGLVLVMEYIEGQLLSEYLKRAQMDVEQTILLGIDVLRGLVEMHAHGIIHRDIKPENIMLRPTENGRSMAVIFDFNLSRVKTGTGPGGKASSLTAMGSAIGTVPFMAPEQLLDARRVTEAADVYSAAAILYRAVSGATPFTGPGSFREKLVMEAPTVQLGRKDPMATGLERVITRALRRKPAERYQDAEEMLSALEVLAARLSRPAF
jgi:serine/threonine-protein kinase